jgi:hypothetical protein
MSAADDLQAMAQAALAAVPGLTGASELPPARAEIPYAVVVAASETDWGHKSGEGREVLLVVTLWDEGVSRLSSLADNVERALAAMASPAEWQLVSLRLVRRTRTVDPAGPCAVALDYRARMLAAEIGH